MCNTCIVPPIMGSRSEATRDGRAVGEGPTKSNCSPRITTITERGLFPTFKACVFSHTTHQPTVPQQEIRVLLTSCVVVASTRQRFYQSTNKHERCGTETVCVGFGETTSPAKFFIDKIVDSVELPIVSRRRRRSNP